jgi:hypothetical protein
VLLLTNVLLNDKLFGIRAQGKRGWKTKGEKRKYFSTVVRPSFAIKQEIAIKGKKILD